jgi:hypothetical protein
MPDEIRDRKRGKPADEDERDEENGDAQAASAPFHK